LNFKYQNWKNTHKYLGIVLFLGGWHMLFIPSDISNNTTLKYYMLGLAIFGAYSYFYRTVFGVYKKNEYKYKLTEVIKINDSIVELKFKPLTESIKFLPGQFVFLRFETGGILSEAHPFSIASSNKGDLSLGIKTLGDYTSMVYLLRPGAICLIEGPFGAFSYLKAESKRQIWIAGGIGITPFLSMARQIDAGGTGTGDYKIDLYYSVKNESEAAFAKEFAEIARRNSNFKFHQHFSEKEGFISANFIFKNDNNIADADIFLCGPASFMQSLREQFVKLGFNNSKIHSEEFSL
jgi:predicted ferric reductase